MIEIDTIRLLRECDKGIKMGISSIDEVWAYVQNERLKSALNICKDQHNNLNIEIQKLLEKYHMEKPKSNFLITLMSKWKIKWRMLFKRNDKTIIYLMIEGCKMGIKSLNKYLQQYQAASEKSKNITKKLVQIEQNLIDELSVL